MPLQPQGQCRGGDEGASRAVAAVSSKRAMQDSSSALHLAACHGHPEVVQTLLEARAEVNHRRMDGSCPAHAAAESGHLQVLHLLMDAGANMRLVNSEGAESPLIQ